MFYKIMRNNTTEGKLFVSKGFLSNHSFINRSSITIGSGGRKTTVEICLDQNLNRNELALSEDSYKSLCIPDKINYQISVKKNSVKIGPVIGLLMAENIDSLSRGRLRKLLDYCMVYNEIQGLIIAFSIEGIDFDNQLVKGFYYNPDESIKSKQWKEGIFPFPDSIFQRINLPEDIRLRLIKETHNRMFNSSYFNKWEFWNMAGSFKSLIGNIPETRLFKSLEDVDDMLKRHEAVYLKPVNGTLSRGLYKVTKVDGVYDFQGKQGNHVITASKEEEAAGFLRENVSGHQYLVQQAIKPLTIDGRHLDFRVIMQKDHTSAWSCTGIVGFVGRKGDICTNWGFTSSFEDTFTKHFNYSQQQIFKKKQEVIAVCKKVCDMLDMQGGNYGDLGFDVMIGEDNDNDKTKDKKVWVLEANKRHYHSVPLWIGDIQTFYEVKAKPIKYAAALAGFEVY